MAPSVLFFGRHFGEGVLGAERLEDRIVSETGFSPWLLDDMTFDDTLS
jgi:hypothetical protein